MRFFCLDFYLKHDCPISEDAVESALSFYGFGFGKRTVNSEEK
jgi:hypothetical protein